MSYRNNKRLEHLAACTTTASESVSITTFPNGFPRRNRSEDPRDSLGYEVWMFRRTQEQLTTWETERFKANRPDELHLYCAVLESFLVHTRSLLYFFYAASREKRDDLIPADFFHQHPCPWAPGPMPAREGAWIKGINKTLQHLTRTRNLPRIDWDEKQIRAAIDTLFGTFNELGPIGGPVIAEHPQRRRVAGSPA